MLNVDQAYMAHYAPLKNRKATLLESIPFSLKWVESEPTEQYWTTDSESWVSKSVPPTPFRQLKKSEISLVHKHIEIYKDIVRNKHKYSLILEDDVILTEDFTNLFNKQLASTPPDWDFIYIGSGCGLRIPRSLRIPNKYAYQVNHPASKCTDSYCITLSAATQILHTIIPFTFPIDFELNYQMKLHDMKIYWWEPPLVQQGSQCGLYKSEIQN